MIKTFIDLFNLLFSLSPFLVSLFIWGGLSILLSKSIKKHYSVYYWVFGVMGVVYALPLILRVLNLDLGFSVSSLPILNVIFSEYSSAAYFVHPIIVVIMYMGALSPKNKAVAKLMSIRKELSIIVGFAVLAHAAKRVLFTFPSAWRYFTHYQESIANPRVVSELGSGISNFVLVLGIVMTALFLVLWITSFDSIRKKMGWKKWKATQRWSYALYAMLFLHAVGLKLGGIVTSHAREKQQIEIAAQAKNNSEEIKAKEATAAQITQKSDTQERPKRFSLSSVKPSRKFSNYFNIAVYILVYGSYLVLRLRKAKRDKLRKIQHR